MRKVEVAGFGAAGVVWVARSEMLMAMWFVYSERFFFVGKGGFGGECRGLFLAG